MSDEAGFAVPKESLKKLYIIYGLSGVGIALVFQLAQPKFSFGQFAGGALILLGALAFAFYVTVTTKVIFLSAEGISGPGALGRRISFVWSDNVSVRSAVYSKMPGLAIEDKGRKRITFPLAIARHPEFQHTLRRLAPPGHALLTAIDKLQ
ncbi:MAG TPA: hypothetical protein VKC56_05520 [Gallionellaceae bacterium]|nr:hypothetical protein [Gallionellaceae bacterium]